MNSFCLSNNIDSLVTFYKQLTRDQLARFFAFTMRQYFHPYILKPWNSCCGGYGKWTALLSSGVGGASEVFEDNQSGLQFKLGILSLAQAIKRLYDEPGLLKLYRRIDLNARETNST